MTTESVIQPPAQSTGRAAQSIFDGVKYLYAESLKGREVTLTIKSVTGGVEFTDNNGKKNRGFDIAFEKTDKVLGVCGVTVRRQLASACGTDDVTQWAGKQITLFPVPSRKAATGQAIRVKCNGGGQ